MRRIYILREDEEDGSVLDAIAAQGADPDDLANPKCPMCGSNTLMAYGAEDEFAVLTWTDLDEESAAEADAWYLVCNHPACPFEEQVHRVRDPMGAELFDLREASMALDEDVGLTSRYPAATLRLINYLEQLNEKNPNRKLDCYIEEAQWHYDEHMAEVRAWMREIPVGYPISFSLGGKMVEATFLAATDEGLLVRTQSDGGLMAVQAEALYFYGPKNFDPDNPPTPQRPPDFSSEEFITIIGPMECVVIRGFTLQLDLIDRLGQYHVSCQNPAAAAALGLKLEGKSYWTGRYRRSDVEARFDLHRLLKVRGHWVERWGEAGNGNPAVHTEDPAAAEALGLPPERRFQSPDEDSPCPTRWSGVVSWSDVEDWSESREYHWPASEAGTTGT